MKVLITGGTGLIGTKLVTSLISQSHEITLLVRPNEAVKQLSNATYTTGDITDESSLHAISQPFDAVIHLAGLTHSPKKSEYYHINTDGTKNILSVCAKVGVKHFIYISSRTASVAGGAYAHSKLLAEQAVEASSLPWTILQPAEVYGVSDREAIGKLVTMVKNKKIIPVIGDGSYELAPVHVDDVVQAITACIGNTAAIRKRYVIAGPESLTFAGLINRIAKHFGVRARTIHLPLFIVKPAIALAGILMPRLIVPDQLPRMLCPKSTDISAAKRDLNFSPKIIEERL